MRNKIIRIIGCALIISGLFIVICSLGLNIRQNSMKKAAIAEFKEAVFKSEGLTSETEEDTFAEQTESEPVAEEDTDKAEAGDILYILRIPSIDSENPVREGVSQGVLADALGHETGTALVGEPGNCVIAGHRNYSFGQFFNRLDEVKIGDYIYVDTAKETFSFAVTDIKVVEPDDLSVLEQTDTQTLTLYTCTPIYLATHRLVIVAERTE